MKDIITTIIFASKTVLKKNSHKFWFIVLISIFIFSYILIPVWLTPGNTLSFQLSTLKTKDYMLFFILSTVTALLLLMQIFLLRSKKKRVETMGQGGVGIFSALFGGLLATAACSSCIAAILGFLGAGTVFFVLDKQPYIVLCAIVLVAVSLYFSARRIQGYCNDCGDYCETNN